MRWMLLLPLAVGWVQEPPAYTMTIPQWFDWRNISDRWLGPEGPPNEGEEMNSLPIYRLNKNSCLWNLKINVQQENHWTTTKTYLRWCRLQLWQLLDLLLLGLLLYWIHSLSSSITSLIKLLFLLLLHHLLNPSPLFYRDTLQVTLNTHIDEFVGKAGRQRYEIRTEPAHTTVIDSITQLLAFLCVIAFQILWRRNKQSLVGKCLGILSKQVGSLVVQLYLTWVQSLGEDGYFFEDIMQ